MAIDEQEMELGQQGDQPSRWQSLRDALAPLLSSRVALIGLAMVLFWVLVAILAPVVSQHDPLAQDYMAPNSAPSAAHWLGTDDLGRDLLARVAYGARPILLLAPLSVACALVVGISLGVTAGYFGGRVDEILMRLLDSLMAFPAILLYLIILFAVGPSAVNVIIAITIAGAPGIARLARSLALDLRTREFVAAAQLRGEKPVYIMFVEILPNAMGPLLVDAMLRVGYATFAIGTLGFLGLGLPPPAPDWGSMVARGYKHIWVNPWAVLWPSLSISSLVVGLNLVADGLQAEMNRYR
jgi:peptide/nickel transport system permease protein